jgi:membrane dipeptidase
MRPGRMIAVYAGAAALSCAGGSTPEELAETALMERARAIHARVVTIDSHVDIPLDYATFNVDPGRPGDQQVDLPKMRAGGLDAAFFIVYVGQTERTPANYARAQADATTKFEAIHRMAEEMYPGEIEIAYRADDVERIAASGKLVAAIGIENGYVIGTDLSLLAAYYRLGARYMTLAHSGHNDIADSSTTPDRTGEAEPEHGGVSEFGAEVIAEMNRLGMMVDISHLSKEAMLAATRLSAAPVIASHSSVAALHEHARNLDDEQLEALRASGGVLQTVALGAFLTESAERLSTAYRRLRSDFGMIPGQQPEELGAEPAIDYRGRLDALRRQHPDATVSDLVDHIDHAVDRIGIDHVGISSDFEGGGGVTGWSDASESLNVTIELVRRGYTEAEIERLWGGNLLRVWREVERVAADLQAAGG